MNKLTLLPSEKNEMFYAIERQIENTYLIVKIFFSEENCKNFIKEYNTKPFEE